jgi:hypothetical protein
LPGYDPRSVQGLFSDVMPAERQAELAEVMSRIRPVGTRVMARAFAEADLRDAVPRIDLPTLLLYGDMELSRTSGSRADATRRPSALQPPLQARSRARNLAESPELVNSHVRAFLSIRRTASSSAF